MWQLVMPDGHVAHESEPFEDRAECEKAAREQGLPLDGMSRTPAADDE